MPFGVKVECIKCEKKEATIWWRDNEGVCCNECHEKQKEDEKQALQRKQKEEELHIKVEEKYLPKPQKIVLRKSTRMTRNYKTRSNPYALPKPLIAKGRGRRGVQRRPLVCSPPDGRSWMRANRVYVQDGYLREGDVVSLVDTDSKIYYAQLRGFVVDRYGEKFGIVTWLLPKPGFKPGTYNPEHYFLGPDEDSPRRLTAMEFEFRPPIVSFKTHKDSKLTYELDNFIMEPIRSL